MNAVSLVMHQTRPDAKELVCKITDAFASVGIAVQVEPSTIQANKAGQSPSAPSGNASVDAVVSVGGDGTLLRANQVALSLGVPLLGINVGRVGFLAELEMDQLQQACLRLKKGDYSLESRMMLNADIGGGEPHTALNDVVISRGGYSRLIAVKAWVDQELVGRYMADGIIVSTPTGSTGYSLSAGGPIVCPAVDCIVLSPICAHSLQHRPVVISSNQKVYLELDCDTAQTVQLSLDGLEPVSLHAKQKVTVTKAEQYAQFIRLEPMPFFNLIRHKLTEWSC